MTIDSAFIACFKSMVPAAFTEEVPFIPQAVFTDGQIKLMCPHMEGVVTWDQYIDRQFTYGINRHFSLGVQCVILAFDDYNHVPVSKSMTQTHRRKHIPTVAIHDEYTLPPVVPTGELWVQLMANRTFKSKLIQMICTLIARRVKMLADTQSLVVDFQGHPIRYDWEGNQCEILTCFRPLGEADVKFMRYSTLYPNLVVNSVDGDTVPCALLHYEKGFEGRICIYRMMTNVSLPVKRKLQLLENNSAAASKKNPSRRVYEYVDVGRLFYVLKRQLTPRGSIFPKHHPGHEISMLVAMIGLAGTDFTRGLPQLSGKTLFESIPCLWSKLVACYDPIAGQLDPEKALENIVCTLYRMKFGKHVMSNRIAGVLNDIANSGLSARTKASIPTDPAVFHCTLRNINWLLLYWRDQGVYPDPISSEYGYKRTPNGGVAFEV